MANKLYRRLCKGLNTKGKLIPSNDNVFDHIKNTKKDHYLSLYLYNEEQKEKFYEEIEKIDSKTGEVIKTIHGAKNINDVVTNKIVFDFDDEDNIDQAKDDTSEAINRLIKFGFNEDDINVTFSGKKGFGVELITDQTFNPNEFKAITKAIAGDLSTFDTTVSNASRIVRVPFTKHQSTEYYKMPLTIEELDMSVDEIKELAEGQYEPEVFDKVTSIPEEVLKLKDVETKIEREFDNNDIKDLDLSQKPRWLSNWKYALQEGFFPKGTRNSALLILGATYRGQGFNKITAYRMLKGAAELQSQRVGEERHPDERIWTEIVEIVYDSSWNGGTYAEDNFPDNLKEYLESLGLDKGKSEEKAFLSANDVYDTFEDFAENIEKNTIKTGITELDRLCRITTSMLVGVLGAPAAGKTATLLNILERHSKEGETSIFFSFDMGKPLVYQKYAQKQTGKSSDDIFKIFVNKDQKEKEIIKHKISEAYSNVQMCFKTGSTVDDMRNYIMEFERQTGKKVRMIAVDYLEKLVGPFSDATANSGYNAAKLQELCNDLELCCLLLLQPQKMAGDPSVPLLTYRNIKGASVIEQDCRVVISVFREGYHPQKYDEDEFITYAVLKNTMGTLGSVDCFWDGRTGTVDTIDEFGRDELKKLRKRKAEKQILDEL